MLEGREGPQRFGPMTSPLHTGAERLSNAAPHTVSWDSGLSSANIGGVAVEANKKKKTQFIGRHIMLKKEYGEKLLEGKKKTTIRIGIVRPKYNELIVHSGGRPIAKVRVVDLKVKKVKELDDNDARLDGFNNRRELLEALRKAYGRIHPEEPVTIIYLDLVQRLDHLDSEDPYLGLSPGDIARIALRYLDKELGEEERRILRDLTVTNSIRGTAYRLYGDPTRRARIRRALRKSLELLIRKGVLRLDSRDKAR
ncbi:MAG: ASCH domain-containing protein [Desulfurococcales archaeon]|nr:ASCH domain-containing protein [Desulfurococcales archaeon]